MPRQHMAIHLAQNLLAGGWTPLGDLSVRKAEKRVREQLVTNRPRRLQSLGPGMMRAPGSAFPYVYPTI